MPKFIETKITPQRTANNLARMEKIGLDTSNEEAVREFQRIWYGFSTDKIGKLTEIDMKEIAKVKRDVSNRLWIEDPWDNDEDFYDRSHRHRDMMYSDPEYVECTHMIAKKRAIKSSKFVLWKRYFNSFFPELMEGCKGAEAQKMRAYDILKKGYLTD